MIGERIKQARKMKGLSLRDLAEKAGISAQAISNYETGKDKPGSSVLIRIARSLGLKVEYFLRPRVVAQVQPCFRKRVALGKKEQDQIVARIQDWLERYLELEKITLSETHFQHAKGFPRKVGSPEEVESAAVELRKHWQLGLDPIARITEVLEERGIKVDTLDAPDQFDACTFTASLDGDVPVMATREGIPGDRQRFDLAHELAHVLLTATPPLEPEHMAHRFAGAFLVPKAAATSELGKKRRTLDQLELHLLKHKYGMSMQAWVYRAKDLNIISESSAANWFKWFRRHGLSRTEPGDQYPPEKPQRFYRLFEKALSEGLISDARAEELLGTTLEAYRQQMHKEHGGFPVGVQDRQ